MATGEETTRETFTRWLKDGETWIGVFENQDLGHRDLGRRVALPFDVAKFDAAVLGLTGAPDHASIGLGWRYVLKVKTRNVDEALTALGRDLATGNNELEAARG